MTGWSTGWKRLVTSGTADDGSGAVDLALAAAERRGFRLGVIGRTCALVAIAVFYLIAISWPNNLLPAAALLAIAGIGLLPLALVGGRYERAARFVIFGFDMAAISAVLAFAPISSGGDVPQNFVFLTSRPIYYYVVLAVSILSLSPALVLWTGFCAVLGVTGAMAWIMSGMEHVVSYGDLPASPTREQYLAVVLNLNFLALPTRVAEALVMALSTGIAALAVHRARKVVRDHAAAEEKRGHVHRLLGRYIPEQVAEQLIDGGQLAPQLREASVLFADIEGFTGLSERLSPQELIAVLNSLFGAATAIIDERGGTVVNHVGDAIIAAFNAPIPVEEHRARAIEAARALQSLMTARDFEGHRLRLRIGVATGPVAAGTVGDARRQTYTIYGDTVNLAQRLERLNKELQTDTLVCAATFGGRTTGGCAERRDGAGARPRAARRSLRARRPRNRRRPRLRRPSGRGNEAGADQARPAGGMSSRLTWRGRSSCGSLSAGALVIRPLTSSSSFTRRAMPAPSTGACITAVSDLPSPCTVAGCAGSSLRIRTIGWSFSPCSQWNTATPLDPGLQITMRGAFSPLSAANEVSDDR